MNSMTRIEIPRALLWIPNCSIFWMPTTPLGCSTVCDFALPCGATIHFRPLISVEEPTMAAGLSVSTVNDSTPRCWCSHAPLPAVRLKVIVPT